MKKIDKGLYELRSVKMHQGREWEGFNANIYKDGNKIGSAYDSGDGGCVDIYFDARELEEEMLAFVKTNSTNDSETLEEFISSLVTESQDVKMVKRDRNKKAYFGKKSEQGEYGGMLRYFTEPYSKKLAEHVKKELGDDLAFIGNEVFGIYPDSYQA